MSLLRFVWQAWHFVTFRRVLERVESRFAWQAQHFCDVFRRCVAVFVAGAALWTCPSSFFVASSRVSNFSCGVIVSMGEAAKSLLFEGFQAGCHVVLRGRHGAFLTPHSTLYTPHFTLHTPHSTHHTLHFPFQTPHYTLRSTLHTLHSPLRTPHFTLHTPHFTLLTQTLALAL